VTEATCVAAATPSPRRDASRHRGFGKVECVVAMSENVVLETVACVDNGDWCIRKRVWCVDESD
jgi:hypothetical protein